MSWRLKKILLAIYVFIAIVCYGPAFKDHKETTYTDTRVMGAVVMSAFWPLYLSVKISYLEGYHE